MTMAFNHCYKDSVGIAAGLLIACIYTLRTSGAHLSAGVSLSIYIIEGQWRKNLSILLVYLFAQFMGSGFGILISYGLLGHNNFLMMNPNESMTILKCFMFEFFFSVIYFSAYAYIKYDSTSLSDDLATRAFALSFIIFACHSWSVLSGGA